MLLNKSACWKFRFSYLLRNTLDSRIKHHNHKTSSLTTSLKLHKLSNSKARWCDRDCCNLATRKESAPLIGQGLKFGQSLVSLLEIFQGKRHLRPLRQFPADDFFLFRFGKSACICSICSKCCLCVFQCLQLCLHPLLGCSLCPCSFIHFKLQLLNSQRETCITDSGVAEVPLF